MALTSGIHMLPMPAFGLMHQLVLLCIGALPGSLYDYVWQPHKRNKPFPGETLLSWDDTQFMHSPSDPPTCWVVEGGVSIFCPLPPGNKVESLSCSRVITPATILTFPFFLSFFLFFFFSLIAASWSILRCGHAAYRWSCP